MVQGRVSGAVDSGGGEVPGWQQTGMDLRLVMVQAEAICLGGFRAGLRSGTLTPVFPLPQSYIQSFRDRQAGSSLGSFMASPTDADYEYGSRGPLTACSGPPVRV